MLLAHHLKALKLPTFGREYDKVARQCAAEGVDPVRFLMRLSELELIDRERRMVERRIKAARFPAVKSLESFDFLALPSLNKTLVVELARCEYIERRENVIALGNSGTGKTHIALGLGLAACQEGLSVGFTTAAALVNGLLEARDEKRLLRLQKQLAAYKLLIIDELGFVPLSKTSAELLFEVFSQRYERGSILATSNLPFDEWTEIFGSERLTGALLDRLTHHVHILEMNGESYRLRQSRKRRSNKQAKPQDSFQWSEATTQEGGPWAPFFTHQVGHLPPRRYTFTPPLTLRRWYPLSFRPSRGIVRPAREARARSRPVSGQGSRSPPPSGRSITASANGYRRCERSVVRSWRRIASAVADCAGQGSDRAVAEK